MNATLGLALSKVLFDHEPGLLVCDMEATAKAAAEIAELLGCILANVVLKQPDQYEELLPVIMKHIDAVAWDTAEKARKMAPHVNVTSH